MSENTQTPQKTSLGKIVLLTLIAIISFLTLLAHLTGVIQLNTVLFIVVGGILAYSYTTLSKIKLSRKNGKIVSEVTTKEERMEKNKKRYMTKKGYIIFFSILALIIILLNL